MQYRRLARDNQKCGPQACEACMTPFIKQVISAISKNQPITFILPAFPGKSPNPSKVLGPRPDMAEELSLAFLNSICEQIQAVYEPGAKIILCSDGRVFSDVVGMHEQDVSQYQSDIVNLITSLELKNLSTFNLEDVFNVPSFDLMRSHLMDRYGEGIEELRLAVHKGGDDLRMYCGILRFLFEDALRPDMCISRTALQRDCRVRAYKVVQRSRAWDKLLSQQFPDAVRLSIHPQVCGSRKIGIHLMATVNEWLTPWHSVAVMIRGSFLLMKHEQVKNLNAHLSYRDGRASHYIAVAT